MNPSEKNNAPERQTESSRFAYHGDEIEEGGVTSVVSKEDAASGPKTGRSQGRPASPGIPGPEERLLDISELVRSIGMHYIHRFSIPAGDVPDLPTAAPTVGQITLTNTGGLLLIKGEADTTLELECGRCLNLTTETVHADLDEAFPLVATNNAYQQEDVQAVDDDTTAAVIKGNVLDLGDLLRQELSLAAPLKPLCREDCPGLKPEVMVEVPITAEPEPVTHNPLRGLAALLTPQEADDEAEENSDAKND